jgi:hypothetical protein
MNFKFSDRKKLSELTNEKNEFADFVELYCLLKTDSRVTKGDVIELISDDFSEEIDDTDDEIEKPDKISQKVNEVFDVLFSRERHYADFYPFLFDKNRKLITQKPNLTRRNHLYIILLLSSNLKYIDDKGLQNKMGHLFELLSFQIFKQLLPKKNSESFVFGAGGNSPFKGNLFTKIKTLSNMLDLPLNPQCTEDELGKNNSGDAGLDMLGWYNFNDKTSGSVMLFAQCACGTKWDEKQIESHTIRWNNYIVFNNKPQNIMFMPRHFRNLAGKWHKNTILLDTILIDRRRIIELARNIPMPRLIKPYKPILNSFWSLPKIDEFD